ALLSRLTGGAVIAAQRAIAEESGIPTARDATKLLRAALRRPIARGQARPELLEDLKGLPPLNCEPRRRVLSDEEIERVRQHAIGTPIELLVELLLATGLRISEALALRWRDIDLANRRLRVERTQVERKGVHYKAPKSKRSRRVVDLSPSITAALHRHREQI